MIAQDAVACRDHIAGSPARSRVSNRKSRIRGGGARPGRRCANQPTRGRTAQHGARGRERAAFLWSGAAAGNLRDLTSGRGREVNSGGIRVLSGSKKWLTLA
jgi:alkylation response protein AidB-like acyl-CoA dehydrogenase